MPSIEEIEAQATGGTGWEQAVVGAGWDDLGLNVTDVARHREIASLIQRERSISLQASHIDMNVRTHMLLQELVEQNTEILAALKALAPAPPAEDRSSAKKTESA